MDTEAAYEALIEAGVATEGELLISMVTVLRHLKPFSTRVQATVTLWTT